jgi:hypothetical protein
MKTRRRQQGMGMLGLLAIATMVGFFVMSGIRITPGYLEYLTVRDIAIRVAEEYEEDITTIADMRRAFADYFNLNQVKAVGAKDVEISRKEGEIVIDASYEERIPLVWRIDVVVKYDDLEFIAGESYSD